MYYTYMWSLVIAKDLFRVRARGPAEPERRRARYRAAMLEPGGSRDAAELVRDFLGRPFGFERLRSWLDAG